MSSTPEPNPQVRALAREAAAQIKTLTAAHEAQIETIYKDFKAKAASVTNSSTNGGEL